MNFEKSKVLLKKINALHQAADEGMGVSSLERDLMLQYVRDFYEAIKEKNKKSKKALDKPKAAFVQEYESELAPSIRNNNPIPPESITAQPKVTNTINSTVPPIVPLNSPSRISEELASLFLESEKEENGSRYSLGSITDIGKSMGINDKILTINELFQGDQGLFNQTIGHLNGLLNFKEAKEYLASGVAEDLNWSKASKKGKAIRFIQLMRRRYSS